MSINMLIMMLQLCTPDACQNDKMDVPTPDTEVLFARLGIDVVAATRKYNNVQLDVKPMKMR